MYLLGIKFKIITDCWALILEEYDYEMVHRAGSVMKHVDALSEEDKTTKILLSGIMDMPIEEITSALKDEKLDAVSVK